VCEVLRLALVIFWFRSLVVSVFGPFHISGVLLVWGEKKKERKRLRSKDSALFFLVEFDEILLFF